MPSRVVHTDECAGACGNTRHVKCSAGCGRGIWIAKGSSANPRCRDCQRAQSIADGGVYVDGLWKYRRNCEACGAEFLGQKRAARFCSTKCNGRRFAHAEYANEVERQTAKTHRRRAKMLNAFVERVVPSKVYERDNWTCQLCHEPVDRTLHGWDRMAATLDHVVPLSLGGLHTYANVQLAHRACNSSKSNNYAGQLPLPI